MEVALVDVALAHSALSIREFFTKHNIPLVPQPPHSPNLVLSDFFPFSKLKNIQNGNRFHKMPEVIQCAIREMNIPNKGFQ
jgi:hypothetical protein